MVWLQFALSYACHDTCGQHQCTCELSHQRVVCIAQRAQEAEKQLASLKQDLAAEEQNLEDLLVCDCPVLLPAAGAFAYLCVLLTLPDLCQACHMRHKQLSLSASLQLLDAQILTVSRTA